MLLGKDDKQQQMIDLAEQGNATQDEMLEVLKEGPTGPAPPEGSVGSPPGEIPAPVVPAAGPYDALLCPYGPMYASTGPLLVG
jgi:hypothetical protein